MEHKTAAQDLAIQPGHPGEGIGLVIFLCPDLKGGAAANQ